MRRVPSPRPRPGLHCQTCTAFVGRWQSFQNVPARALFPSAERKVTTGEGPQRHQCAESSSRDQVGLPCSSRRDLVRVEATVIEKTESWPKINMKFRRRKNFKKKKSKLEKVPLVPGAPPAAGDLGVPPGTPDRRGRTPKWTQAGTDSVALAGVALGCSGALPCSRARVHHPGWGKGRACATPGSGGAGAAGPSPRPPAVPAGVLVRKKTTGGE